MKHKKLEFTKILAIWAALVGTISVTAAFVFSAFDKQPASDLAIAISLILGALLSAMVGYLVSYILSK